VHVSVFYGVFSATYQNILRNVPDTVDNPLAPPGKSTKYGRRELERRFLLAEMPPGDVERTTEICDRYIEGTRLRLRKTVERDDTRVIYKLTQKVPAPDAGASLVTTLYLSEEEYERLRALPALVLEKTRFTIPPFGIDSFAAPRDGLWLAEVEFEGDVEMQRFAVPLWAIAEVTADPRFTGGRLVRTGRAELSELLRAYLAR
jgi:CYTH domain-containing protein